jgi:hypothetical protein
VEKLARINAGGGCDVEIRVIRKKTKTKRGDRMTLSKEKTAYSVGAEPQSTPESVCVIHNNSISDGEGENKWPT